MPSVIIRRFAGLVCLGMGGLTVWLALISLHWPLVGDAAMFQFAGAQFLMGAVPYRDFIDMNMPLVYALHAAIIYVAGMGDFPFRLCDLACSLIIGLLAAALVWPAGRILATLAALTIIAAHLLSGPPAAGQRDYLLLVPALAAVLCIILASEKPARATLLLFAAGSCIGFGVILKPTAILLIALAALNPPWLLRRVIALFAGVALVGLVTLAALAHLGSLLPFFYDAHTYSPFYAKFAHKTLASLTVTAVEQLVLQAGGLGLAAIYGVRFIRNRRARILLGFAIFGLIHYVIQGKGFFYHLYPLIAAVICLGAWTLARSPRNLALAVLAISFVVFAARGMQAVGYAQTPGQQLMPAPATAEMQAALTAHLPPGSRVEMLDISGGAFLAMARSGMRQANPFAYWFFLDPGRQIWRDQFMAQIKSQPPAAFLVTNSMLPAQNFDAVDKWPALSAELACCYVLTQASTITAPPNPWDASAATVSWRLYTRR